MAYSVLYNGTDISGKVVGVGQVPIIDTTFENFVVLPSMDMTVIMSGNTWAKGAVVVFRKSGVRFAQFIVEDISYQHQQDTATMRLVDSLILLNNYYARDIGVVQYFDARNTSEDLNQYGVSMRYYAFTDGGSPYRRQFVTLTYYIRTALMVAGLAEPEVVDTSDMYGDKSSGLVYYNRNTQADIPVRLEELCFHPNQIKWAKLENTGQENWEGATLLDVVLYCLTVLKARIRYSGSKIVIERQRADGTVPGQSVIPESITAYSYETWLRNYDMLNLSLIYQGTVGGGFGGYVAENIIANANENWAYPLAAITGKKPSGRSVALMRHAVVHYRYPIGMSYECHEFDLEAYDVADPSVYKYGRQFAGVLWGRVPQNGTVLRYTSCIDVAIRGSIPIKYGVDVVNNTIVAESLITGS